MSNIDILVMEARKSKVYLVIKEGRKKLEAYFYNDDFVTEILDNSELVNRYIGEKNLIRQIKLFSNETIQKVVDDILKEQKRFDIPKNRLFNKAELIAEGEKLERIKNIISFCCTPPKYCEYSNCYVISASYLLRLTDSTLWGIIGNLHLQKIVRDKNGKCSYPIMSEEDLLLELLQII